MIPTIHPTTQTRLAGLYGLLLGDAAGVPYEFHRADEIRESSAGALVVYPYDERLERRAHEAAPRAAWSDDGAMCLALMDAVRQEGDRAMFDFDRLSQTFKAWYLNRSYCVDGVLFDIGNQTRAAMRKLIEGVPAENCGLEGEMHNGNGSLMRTLGLVFAGLTDRRALVLAAMDQSLITHAHLKSQVTCALLCSYGLDLLHGVDDLDASLEAVRDILKDDFEALEALDQLQTHRENFTPGSPFVFDTFWSAVSALGRGKNHRGVVHEAILMGNDTDTTGAIAGGLAGLKWGMAGIDPQWIDNLPKQADCDRIMEQMMNGHHHFSKTNPILAKIKANR